MSTQIQNKPNQMLLKNWKVLKFKTKDAEGKDIAGVIHENGETYKEGDVFVTSVKRAEELGLSEGKLAEAKGADLKD